MQARTKKRGTGANHAGARRRVDIETVRQDIRNFVGGRALEMVKATVEEIEKKGNVAALKFLFELAGLCPGGEEEPAFEDDGSLASTLLKRLGAPGAPAAATGDGSAGEHGLE